MVFWMCAVDSVMTQVQPYLDPAERVYPTWQSCSPSGSFHNNTKKKTECVLLFNDPHM